MSESRDQKPQNTSGIGIFSDLFSDIDIFSDIGISSVEIRLLESGKPTHHPITEDPLTNCAEQNKQTNEEKLATGEKYSVEKLSPCKLTAAFVQGKNKFVQSAKKEKLASGATRMGKI